MNKLKDIIFYSCLILLPIIQVLRAQDISGSNLLFLLLLGVLFIYFTTEAAKETISRKTGFGRVVIYVLLLLATVTLFAKYFNTTFWDNPSLLIVPAFILFSLYFLRKKGEAFKLKAATSVYLLFMIPLFLLIYAGPLGDFVPRWWYKRYSVYEATPVKLPYSFEFEETENLSVQAFELKKQGEHEEAISLYRKALRLEPKNPKLYFDLSECYAYSNEIGKAISMLNSAIELDSNFAPFYNNRGLLYYQLSKNNMAARDYKSAIALDSTQGIYYANLALALNKQGFKPDACDSIRKAEKLNVKVDDYSQLKVLKNYCNQQ